MLKLRARLRRTSCKSLLIMVSKVRDEPLGRAARLKGVASKTGRNDDLENSGRAP